MKKVVVLVCVVAALATVSQAGVLAYEGFGQAANGAALTGYSGTSEVGLSGT
jgi:hypothetical protein